MNKSDRPSRQPSRRVFLKRAAAGAALVAPVFLAGRGRAAQGAEAPSARITLGVIGIGPRMTYDLKAMLGMPDVQCVMIAEVQAGRRDKGKALVDQSYGNSDCKVTRDFRELLGRKDIDAVLIGTGDRWHALAAIMAAEAGKDIYCEKPCGLTIELCQRIDETMKRTQRIYQAGTQRRSIPNFQQAVKLAQGGKLGKLRTLHASVYRPSLRSEWLPSEPTPDPAVVDWNLWLGPAPWRPYNAKYVAGDWRGYWDFDAGARLLDWGAHTLDLCQWANQADETLPVEYEPTDQKIICRYANGVEAVLDFLDKPFGDRAPKYTTEVGTCPVKFVGEAGSVETGDAGMTVVRPESLTGEAPAGGLVKGLDVAAHARNFFECVKSRKPTICNSSVMRHSHIACHAAALSWILSRRLRIDPKTETFINDDEANRLRSRPAREPWKI